MREFALLLSASLLYRFVNRDNKFILAKSKLKGAK